MKSIRSRIILLTIFAIIVSLSVTTVLSVFSVRELGYSDAEKMLLLLCETGEKNLDSYFVDVEKSVDLVSSFVESDLIRMRNLDELQSHVERMRQVFARTVTNTQGVLTYYYRLSPEVSDDVTGFWFVKSSKEGFEEHDVTDLSGADLDDTSSLIWFTVPRTTGKSVWLPPYITENLGAHVLSYNVPVYRFGRFIGVVGIEIDYSTVAEQVNHIKLFEHGYAFINDPDGNLIYHPSLDMAEMDEFTAPDIPPQMLDDETLYRYEYNGVEKLGVRMPLSNGMRLNVSVPVSEINENWQELIVKIVAAALVLLVFFALFAFFSVGKITKPLKKLTEAAEQVNAGNYDCDLTYHENNEVGILTQTVSNLVSHLKVYISDLNDLAYADALTSVRNRGAFEIYLRNLQAEITAGERSGEYAICIFDCNNLKKLNDTYGHGKGDLYLKATCSLICTIFNHSPVFRIGGDEFSVILQGSDFNNREALLQELDQRSAQARAASENPWDRIDIAGGVAVFDPENDQNINDVVRRADKIMYETKWRQKRCRV